MNSCMFLRHYEGKVLHFDKDLKSKDQRLKNVSKIKNLSQNKLKLTIIKSNLQKVYVT